MSSDRMDAYFEAGARRAAALGNRGPIRFDADGRLAADILETYRETGFYVFEGVVDETELAELHADFETLLARMPATEGAETDTQGRPVEYPLPNLQWARPLSDPWGGTKLLNGRHPVQMEDLRTAREAPNKTIFLLLGLFESMGAALRLSAHPDMLRVAASLNGPDFVPYNDSIFLKEPGMGAAVSWHQDGTTHWDAPDWDPDIHGVNFMAQLCRTTPANGLWVVPGSHREGHVDIPARVATNGESTLLPDAVPMLCEAGDVAICNRQCLHGSFANASPDRRATFVWGFFRHDAVLDVEVDVPVTSAGQKPERKRYTQAMIDARAEIVQIAIEARAAHRPDEAAFEYAAASGHEGRHASPEARQSALRGYARGTIFV